MGCLTLHSRLLLHLGLESILSGCGSASHPQTWEGENAGWTGRNGMSPLVESLVSTEGRLLAYNWLCLGMAIQVNPLSRNS
jgi:hypothetical protein